MTDTAMADLPVVGLGVEIPWPLGVAKDELVLQRGSIAVWSGADPKRGRVCVTVACDALDAAGEAFVAAARGLRDRPARDGVLAINSVDADARWVLHAPVVGALDDVRALGWDVDRKVELFAALCMTVAPIHQQGSAHGGLDPLAIALDEDMVPVLVSDGGAGLWSFGAGVGYVAPEVLGGAVATARSDVYSLGRLLAFLLLDDDPPSEPGPNAPWRCLQRAPARLRRIVRRATSPDPAARHADARELLRDVANLEPSAPSQTMVSAPAPPPAKPQHEAPAPRAVVIEPKEGRARPRTHLLAALTLALLGGLGVLVGDPFHIARWRAHRAFVTADPAQRGAAMATLVALGERDLGAVSLAGADLSRAPISGVALANADLSHAVLDGADLGGANLAGATFDGVSALGTNLSGAELAEAKGLETVACDEATLPPAGWRCRAGRLAAEETAEE